ncbi:transglycosylase domain-containing protein [Melittangium boletus]|uniref:Monofunctional biosynthetic peptidoglycan transglycosylase n=1 Tax=Melittangium boletus DSM 14713 TaxID=1294270 RepID=A0A250I6Q8_9BACT|nr:biosynthetic peptidoglycan transglycosylase [Melittangium boletus]ATB27549.1 monofunctional biosynthetic peptidoglycan transglycosylase [Melittangium boletus DSM 14713]
MPSRRLLKKGLLVLVGLLVALAAAGTAAHVWLQGEGARAQVVGRFLPALEARVGPVRLGNTFRVGWTGTVTLGPLELPGSQPEGPPVVSIAQVTVHPRLRALLSGRVEASQVVLSDVTVDAGPSGSELQALLERMRAPRSAPSPTPARATARVWPELVLEDVHLAFERHGRVRWGPLSARVRLENPDGTLRMEATARLPGGGSATMTMKSTDSGMTGTLQGRDIPAGPLLSLGEPPVDLEGGVMEGAVTLEGSGAASFSLAVKGLSLSNPRLAPEPVGPLTFSAEGRLRGQWARRTVALESLRVTVGERREVQVDVTGEASWSEPPRFSLSAELSPLTFAQAVAALPPALVPEDIDLAQQEGELQASLALSGPLFERRDWQLKAKLELPRKKGHAQKGPLAWLRGPFDYRPLTAEGRGQALRIGPNSPTFVPFEEFPPYLVRAVLRSEDGGFWTHQGFDFDSLRTLLLDPRDGKVRGGSTLTQQLAKNLFLSREKTYARKVKEALLTLALESAVPKQRLLELYFNIIEWGPNLYGIGAAASHYFDKPAYALSVREAAFLATIIPNPVRYHGYCTQGALSDVWARNVDTLLGKLLADGALTEPEYQQSLAERLAFACTVDARTRSVEAPSAE